jgi:RHH-type proline utilization regulon transcriptional repressor/proline dehydrogenase/delta 1-pyrroline-5-carboxylate dehydrogenase
MQHPPDTPRLPSPTRPEHEVARALLPGVAQALDWPAVIAQGTPWVQAVRQHPAPFWALESLLREYPLSSAEGLALMRLAEALLRVPDSPTAQALAADQLGRAAFSPHPAAEPEGPLAAQAFGRLSAEALALSKKFLPDDADAPGSLWQRLGAQTVVAALVRGVGLLGRQFVLGQDIHAALAQADHDRADTPGLRFSFDMLGEGARTEADAQRHLAAYLGAVRALAAAPRAGADEEAGHGVSIKLSALHPRYEEAQRHEVLEKLVPRVWQVAEAAARAQLSLTLDAEESERLELSLDVFELLCQRVARHAPAWRGFGLAVQAYQTRAVAAVHEIAHIAHEHQLRCMVRLVKGAYWDAEIKRAQELGLPGYPVFTHKHHTDLSYLACAQALLGHAPRLYPQFATHNVATIAAVWQLARQHEAPFEMQRLHGMGEGVYREVMRDPALRGRVPVRVYAPVGPHRDLLAYLVRRLLENGANASFVHQLNDAAVDLPTLLASPLRVSQRPALPLPGALYGTERPNAAGLDLSSADDRQRLRRALHDLHAESERLAPGVAPNTVAELAPGMAALQQAWPEWAAQPVAARAAVLRQAAAALEAALPAFCALLIVEAHKTWGDALAEVREAVDFLRYYAAQAERQLQPLGLPGPVGERNELRLRGRGVFVCISPWNFPLAIFVGQVAAALVCGNCVAAKPAEQTPRVAARAVALLHAAGVPAGVLRLFNGRGEDIGAGLVADPRGAGVCFTGSMAAARSIQLQLAQRDGPLVPLIAETGGVNAMLVDSTALPEQVVDAVMQSAFRSAGQRCSALRLLCLHRAIAEPVIEMLRGALQTLRLGDPRAFDTDVGPLIDGEAAEGVRAHITQLRRSATLIAEGESPRDTRFAQPDWLVPPVAFEVADLAAVRAQGEIFGPVLQVLRWGGPDDDGMAVIGQLNALGYGLTLGLHTRIDSRAQRWAAAARVGNVYVNRNMVGAVVGVQPFGGEGLSGTGPKAGGPHYLPRFCTEQTVSVNTAAAGGNVDLLVAAAVVPGPDPERPPGLTSPA